MRSSSEWPKDGAVSFLSDALEPAPPIGVLVEPESLCGSPSTGAEERARLAAEAENGARSAGFKYHQGSGAGGIGYEEEVSPTCTADWHNPAVITDSGCLNSCDVQSKRIFSEGGVAPTLPSGTCEGMNIQPSVLQEAPIAMADLNANTAIDENMVGTLKVGGDAPTVCI